MTAVKFACISPHPPIIVPEIGRGREREVQRTIDALEQVARDLTGQKPETLVLIATHGPVQSAAFGILTTPAAEGDLSQWGAPQVRLRFDVDTEAVTAICEEARRASVPLDPIDGWDLDWSCTVPLYYLRSGLEGARLVPLCIAFLSPRQHFALGQAVRRAVDRLGRPVAVIASADLSHRLSEDGPYGFDPAGPEFDHRIQEALARWDIDAVLSMPLDFREQAGEDAVPSISFLMGALDGLSVRPRVLSYEGPWGVGYMVAAVDILGDKDKRERDPLSDDAEVMPPLSATSASEAETPATPSHPLVRLARDAVEAWVRRREVIAPSDDPAPPDLPTRAGCFVTIKTRDGALRGCIGTVEPTQPTLAQEVVRNAIDSASRDPRFLAVTCEELDDLVYSVDVLAEPEPIEGPHQLDPRRYGVIVRSGQRRGLLLPDLEGVDSTEQQVAIAKAKAGILPDEPVELRRFEVKRLS